MYVPGTGMVHVLLPLLPVVHHHHHTSHITQCVVYTRITEVVRIHVYKMYVHMYPICTVHVAVHNNAPFKF
jgi:hypothetical protein